MVSTEEKPYVVGIDLGGTNTAFGIVDARGNVLASNSIKTQLYPELDKYMDALSDAMKKLIADNCGIERVKGIGIGAPNANYYTGNIEHAANLPWKGIVPFAKLLSEKMGVPVALTNDANAAAIGEATYGAARGMKDFVMITLGTGVGSGIYANGQLVYGHDGNAGELGHVIVRRGGRQCGCGNKGCLETYTSATGVARTAREFLEQNPAQDSLLRKIPADQITSKDVYDAATSGDKMAQDIFQFTGQILGEAFADFVKFSSPEAIILFGGLAHAGDLLLVPIMKSMDENLMPVFRGKIKVLFSKMKDADAAILGASALAWDIKA
ncbi:MAG: ROK family protein [Paludibacteraceae bacterium]|jgi:glucokinase|nr:ROK family protein [Paludibacteraceae bacterium]